MLAGSSSRILSRIAAVCLAGGLVAACSSESTRFAGGLTPPQAVGTPDWQSSVAPRAVVTPLPPAAPAPVASDPLPSDPRPPPTEPTATWRQSGDGVSARPPAAEASHVVAPGETLYALGRRYRVSPLRIAEANNLPADTRIRIGQKIAIPAAAAVPVRVAAAKAPGTPDDEPAAAEPKPSPKPSAPQPDPPAGKPADASAPPPPAEPPGAPTVQSAAESPRPGESEPARLSPNSFRWPVRGRIISEFGQTVSGQRNDGINLAVPEGTPVKAAENGVVAYAGDELKGYGNLVLVRHEGDFVTAYAHASEILVKRGDTVRRGQIIAKVGQTGNVNTPQLHFEIRKNAKPVNPTEHLSGA